MKYAVISFVIVVVVDIVVVVVVHCCMVVVFFLLFSVFLSHWRVQPNFCLQVYAYSILLFSFDCQHNAGIFTGFLTNYF